MRQNPLVMLTICFLSAVLLFQANAFAKRIDEATYQYPYKDPYLATTTIALLKDHDEEDQAQAGRLKDLRVKVLENRNNIHLLEGKGTIRYRFYQRKEAAPLIFIIPGLAGSAYSGSAAYLAEWMTNHGFHVIILPSPFNWNFTLAASTTGYPGYSQEDSENLYTVMRLVLDEVKNRYHAQIGKIGVLGLSDGALYSAYLSKIDSEKKQIGAEIYLLVNPPVDLFESARKVDQMADLGKGYQTDRKEYLEAYAQGVGWEAQQQDIDDPSYFSDWDKRLQLNDKQIQYLIGKEMRDAVGDAVYVVGLANDAEILKTPISWGYRSARLKEARTLSLMDYAKTFLLPKIQQAGHKNMSLKALDNLNSIRRIQPFLEKKPNIFLMHNLDDILVSREDIAYLENLFGDRALIYPHGGHMGNLWYPENKQHIAEIFSTLLLGRSPYTHSVQNGAVTGKV